ncbi:hypothetical protein LTS10_005365 [Elasticomyces elasticus]|nr:hypothetical protein LTS10_005365 [Elasticomyces elasticus]
MSNTTSRLLALPAELRSHIWELVLLPKVFNGDSTVHGYALTVTKWNEDYRLEDGDKVQGAQPPITRVNRQLRSETLPTFYNLNTFEVDQSSYNKRDKSMLWLRSQGESAAHIRSLYGTDMFIYARTAHIRVSDCSGTIPRSAISIICGLRDGSDDYSTALLLRWKRAVEALESGIGTILEGLEVKNISLRTWQLVLDCLGRFFAQTA